LPKQSPGFQKIASLKNARNDNYKITLNEYKFYHNSPALFLPITARALPDSCAGNTCRFSGIPHFSPMPLGWGDGI
jgi:hypothetical protein